MAKAKRMSDLEAWAHVRAQGVLLAIGGACCLVACMLQNAGLWVAAYGGGVLAVGVVLAVFASQQRQRVLSRLTNAWMAADGLDGRLDGIIRRDVQ